MKDKIVCEKCGERDEDDIRFWQRGTSLYTIYVNDNEIKYRLYDFDDNESACFYCRECGRDIHTTEEEIIEIYSNKNGE